MKVQLPPIIPDRLKSRPTWHGMPIPFSTLIYKDGTPDFKVTDQANWIACVTAKLCGVCGEPLDARMFFIGGDKSMQHQCFFDPPMHEDCARYSFEVCPYLAGKKDHSPAPPKMRDGYQANVHQVVSTERPKRMGLLPCAGYEMVQVGDSFVYHAVGCEAVEWRD